MTRKQQEIPGFEWQRPATWAKENPAIEEAAVSYDKLKNERSAMSKKETLAGLTLLATLKAQGVEAYEYVDEDGNVRVARIKHGKESVEVEKTGEVDEEVGEGVDVETGPSEGLLEQSKKAQADINVEENDAGDVVVPDKAAPKAKKGKSGKKAK